METKEVVWNYECIRDFCGGFYSKIENHNDQLVYVLPTAIDAFLKSEDDLPVKEEFVDEYLFLFTTGEDLIDHRSGKNIKEIVLNSLITGVKPSDDEVAAFLDYVYVDNAPARMEIVAESLIKAGAAPSI